MRKFNAFRSKLHQESPRRTKSSITTTTLKTNSRSDNTTPTQPIHISAPIINYREKVVINNKDQCNENPNEEQTTLLENDDIEEQITISEEPEDMSDESDHIDDQPVSSLSSSTNQSSLSTKTTESTTMVGNNPKEDILTSCKATAMIYNDAQKKWIHCAPNGPAKIQLLFAPDTQTYRIVGRQIQDHEVVLNHSISKGLKYNQATPTFHQWRDQACVYGLNFSSKLDAQEFGTTMMKILESVNGPTNLSSQTNTNGGATLLSATLSNNNNNSTTSYKRQTIQPSSSLPPAATTISLNSTSSPSSSSSVSEPTQQQQQQQQQHSSSSYNTQLGPNSNSVNSTLTSTNNNYYSQRQQPAEEDDTNYALISDSYSSYGDTSTNKNNNIPQAPTLNSAMSTTGTAPPAAPPPPPPPPPPPLPNGFGGGPPPAPTLVLPTTNGNGGANTARKTSSTAPPMDLMSEMAAKFAQRRKNIDENDKTDSANTVNNTKATPKGTTTATLPPATPGPVQTSPRASRKTSESQPTTHYTSNDLEKLKTDILNEIRKDIEKAKQEILTAILDHQKSTKK